MDVLIAQMWQMAYPYLGGAWATLQRIFVETPAPLLVGIVIGLLLTRMLRSMLIVVGVVAMGFVAVRMFGISAPALG